MAATWAIAAAPTPWLRCPDLQISDGARRNVGGKGAYVRPSRPLMRAKTCLGTHEARQTKHASPPNKNGACNADAAFK